mmetsp:Transcript_59743/g.177029  ORF Transcript_59743/g.177029 Transcript_59743/m.177029 type:complete len:252 (-) Transcript_59743:1106-1861(-)
MLFVCSSQNCIRSGHLSENDEAWLLERHVEGPRVLRDGSLNDEAVGEDPVTVAVSIRRRGLDFPLQNAAPSLVCVGRNARGQRPRPAAGLRRSARRRCCRRARVNLPQLPPECVLIGAGGYPHVKHVVPASLLPPCRLGVTILDVRNHGVEPVSDPPRPSEGGLAEGVGDRFREGLALAEGLPARTPAFLALFAVIDLLPHHHVPVLLQFHLHHLWQPRSAPAALPSLVPVASAPPDGQPLVPRAPRARAR